MNMGQVGLDTRPERDGSPIRNGREPLHFLTPAGPSAADDLHALWLRPALKGGGCVARTGSCNDVGRYEGFVLGRGRMSGRA